MNNPYEINTAPPTIGTPKDAATLRELLKTPYDRVYKVSPDGRTFLEPLLLRGTLPESERKREVAYLSQLDPSNKSLRIELKRYRDNSSKFKKIREVFGEQSRYHPNQLISKDYMPPGGLCQKELMYRLACKISDLKHLHRTGFLAMDPFDFIRWRLLKKAASFMPNPGDNPKRSIRTIVYKLCDDSVNILSKQYQDSVMRHAVLMSAAQRNQLAIYGPRGRTRKYWLTDQRGSPYSTRAVASPQKSRLTEEDVVDHHSASPLPLARRAERRAAARARALGAAASTTPIYAGVNAFRAQQQQRREAQRRQEAEERQSTQGGPDAN
ncbi:hypothetical protein CCMA1212_001377 [Trichoderma ghanense]|uniref:Uncharacterized protein n=1 Tax=Trichoderma ghanense TaxID=65468 RepID=A0ABY2HFJ5_9HYPO